MEAPISSLASDGTLFSWQMVRYFTQNHTYRVFFIQA